MQFNTKRWLWIGGSLLGFSVNIACALIPSPFAAVNSFAAGFCLCGAYSIWAFTRPHRLELTEAEPRMCLLMVRNGLRQCISKLRHDPYLPLTWGVIGIIVAIILFH